MSRAGRDMTVGSPAGHILYFALPLLAGSLLQQLYNLADSFVVGRHVGDAALAAVGVGSPIAYMFISLFTGLGNGATVVIAQFLGAGKKERVQDAVDTVYTAFILSALPITLAAVAVVRPLLSLMQVAPDAYGEAELYLTVVCAGIIGTIGYNLNAGILAGLGNSRTTVLFLTVSSAMNIVLDLVLVLWAGLGVLGVALGTVISQVSSWLFGLFYLNRRYTDLTIRPFSLRFDKLLFRQIMGIGLPAGIQMSLMSIGSIVVMGKINSFGKAFTAAYNLGARLDQLAFLPVQSLSGAVTSFVGQNIGARRLDRAKQGLRFTVVTSVVLSAIMAAVTVPTAPQLIGFFTPSQSVIDAGAVYLKCMMPFYIPFSVMFCLNNAMRGAGESVFPMVHTIFFLIVLRVPMICWLADRFGSDYMYYGMGICWTLGAICSIAYYASGRWKRHGSLADRA